MSLKAHRYLFEKVVTKAKEFHSGQFKSNPESSGNYDNDRNKDAFGRALKGYIEEETGVDNPFNHRTLINILNAGIAPNARSSTVDVLAKFIGFTDFEEFSGTYKNTGVKSYFRIGVLVFFVVSGLITAFFTFRIRSENQAIKELIINANKAQFYAYRALPDVRIQNMKEYYTENSSALKVIEDILKRSSILKRTVSFPKDNPSYYTIHEIRILERKGDRAVAVSDEHWYLRWFSFEKNNYIKKYDVTNSQVYILIKENEVWKIDANDYTGTATNIQH